MEGEEIIYLVTKMQLKRDKQEFCLWDNGGTYYI